MADDFDFLYEDTSVEDLLEEAERSEAPVEQVVPLTTKQLDIVNYCEEYWMTNGKFPPHGTLTKRFSDQDIDGLYEFATFKKAMFNRGIPIPDRNDQLIGDFTKEQIAAATAFLDTHDTRKLSTKLAELGIRTTQWNNWMRDKRFQQFVLNTSSKSFDEDALAEAQIGLRQSISKGDNAAIKLYMELTGRYSQEQGTIGNVNMVVSQIIESIQKHVKDPLTLKLIRDDFELILNNRGAVAQLPTPQAVIEVR